MAPIVYGLWGSLTNQAKGMSMLVHMKLDLELLAEQKQILLEEISDVVDEEDKRFKLWGLIEMIDHIQDNLEGG